MDEQTPDPEPNPRNMYMTTAGELADFLEAEIAAGREPVTQAEWAECMRRFVEHTQAKFLGRLPEGMTPGYVAASLRDEGINCLRLRSDGTLGA